MAVALYPGSFDPIHNGHLQVIEATAPLFDSLIVGVGHNPDKPSGLFTADERTELIRATVAHLDNVRVELFVGLATAAAATLGADCLLKGVRGSGDFDSEMQQATMNSLTGGIPTLFAPAMGETSLVSSRYVREIAAMGGDIRSVVPATVAAALHERFAS
jgi:pantetheine-phosphate adenylyltransferase